MADAIGPTGNFGRLAEDYERGRKDYPESVIEDVHGRIPARPALVLDLGCGTGKSTRQLAEDGLLVIGADPDPGVLAQAMTAGGRDIAYCRASAEALPFSDGMFHAVTTFSSFHWWWNVPGALDSVYRVLKPSGRFVIVNKEDAGTFRADVRGTIERITGQPPRDARKDYDPAAILARDGRWEMELALHTAEEAFTPDQLMRQIRSMSSWNALTEDQRPIAESALKALFEPRLQDGLYRREIVVRVVTGVRV